MKLGDYTKIRTGLVLSRKESTSRVEAHQYTSLTLKALNENGMIDRDATEAYSAAVKLKREYFTQKGDVLLRLSAPYTATLIMESDEDLLVSSHFIIIRVKQDHLVPYYLHWWLTQNRKRFYKAASGGTMMGTISAGYIGGMEIVLPPITEQANIGNLIRLTYREQQLLTILAEQKKRLVDSAISNYTSRKGETRNG